MSRVQLRKRLPKLPKRKIRRDAPGKFPKLSRRERVRQEVWVYNGNHLEEEKINPERLMRLIYENPVGGASLLWLVKRKAVSRLYGLYCRTPLSARNLPKFIEKYNIDMTGCPEEYRSFAQFFSREKENVTFPESREVLGSPCEGMVSMFTDIAPDQVVAAKGSSFSLGELFGDKTLAAEYAGGTMVSIRLTPANYHRMHFFDDGVVKDTNLIKGDLYSVSPLALNRIVRLYCRNKRAVVKMDTQNFGEVALVEVGATFVGSIVHCFEEGDSVERGQVASYFKPGGSLILMFVKKDKFTPNPELVTRTSQGYETRVAIGEPLGGL